MTHVDDASHDFDDLEGLDPKIADSIKLARLEARDIIDRLEPQHIGGWFDLMRRLESSLEIARNNRRLFDASGSPSLPEFAHGGFHPSEDSMKRERHNSTIPPFLRTKIQKYRRGRRKEKA